MISLISYDDAPGPIMQDEVNSITKAHAEFTNRHIIEALMKRFGEIPPLDVISEHVLRVIDTDGVNHYVWVDTIPQVGEKVDMTDVLCSIAPPEIYKP